MAAEVPDDAVPKHPAPPLGVAVHVGASDGVRELELLDNGARFVHGLALDDARRDRARAAIRAAGREGQAVVETAADVRRLPYADHLINLVVADLDALAAGAPPVAEIERVLAPGGRGQLKRGGQWSIITKARPAGMDQWTHPRQGPDEAKVSNDRLVDVPTGVQWLAAPLFALGGRKSSTEGFVSAGGRNFYLTQNVLDLLLKPDRDPPNYLVARDAANGVLLWSRACDAERLNKSGAVNMRLVASDDQVFIIEEGQLVALDAATGDRRRSFATDVTPDKFLHLDGLLIAETRGGIVCFDAVTSQKRWEHESPLARDVGTRELIATPQSVAFLETDGGDRSLVLLDPRSGVVQWRKPVQTASVKAFSKGYLDIAFASAKEIGLLSREELLVLSATDGKERWKRKIDGDHYGCVYLVGAMLWLREKNDMLGLDLADGGEQKKFDLGVKFDSCQPPFATSRLVIEPRRPVVLDLESGEREAFAFARGGCGSGFVAANGLLYTTPNACACYPEALRGFVALTSAPVTKSDPDAAIPLEKGPAYGADNAAAAVGPPQDWPTHRHDPQRSGHTEAAVPAKLRVLWTESVASAGSSPAHAEWQLRGGGLLTSPVVAGGRVFVARPNQHQVVAIDAETGKPAWTFTAGGRIDSPPSIVNGLCLFGSHDGWVYCIRAADGVLAWRSRLAPGERRIVAYGQVESAWPVGGSVLVHDGLAYAAAGRTPAADGGLHVAALDPHTGRVVWRRNVAESNKTAPPDLLTSNGDGLCVAGYELDWKTGDIRRVRSGEANLLRGGSAGLLENAWTRVPLALRKGIHTWKYGEVMGELLAFDRKTVWGYTTGESGKAGKEEIIFAAGDRKWKAATDEARQVEAMIVTRDHLFAAGTADRKHRRPERGGFVMALGAEDGRVIAEMPLPATPVFDGIAAARGRLFIALEDGRVVCLAP